MKGQLRAEYVITVYVMKNYVLRQVLVSWKTWQLASVGVTILRLRGRSVGFISCQSQLTVGQMCVHEASFSFCIKYIYFRQSSCPYRKNTLIKSGQDMCCQKLLF